MKKNQKVGKSLYVNVVIVKHWKIKSSKPIIFTCGCEVFAKHIPKWVYDYPSIHVNEIEMLERCISKVVV